MSWGAWARIPLVSRAFGTRHCRCRANITHTPIYAPPRKKFQSPPLGIPAKEQEEITDKVVCKCLIAQDASFHILVIRKHGKYTM